MEGSNSSHRTVSRQRRLSDRSILFRVSTVLFFPKQGYGAWCSGLVPLSSCSLIEHAYLFAIVRCCTGVQLLIVVVVVEVVVVVVVVVIIIIIIIIIVIIILIIILIIIKIIIKIIIIIITITTTTIIIIIII